MASEGQGGEGDILLVFFRKVECPFFWPFSGPVTDALSQLPYLAAVCHRTIKWRHLLVACCYNGRHSEPRALTVFASECGQSTRALTTLHVSNDKARERF